MKIIIAQADVPNKNGRVYPKELFEEVIKKEVVFGTPLMTNDTDLDVSKISHKVTNLRLEDGFLVGELKVLDTQYGDMLKLLPYDENSFRMAGYGKVEDGKIVDYTLIAINYTENPA